MARPHAVSPWIHLIVVPIFGLIGCYLAAAGGYLLWLGGSPYYLVAGLLIISVAVFIATRNRLASWIFHFYVVLTIAWAVYEAGWGRPWGLMPRILLPAGMALWFALPSVRAALDRGPILFGRLENKANLTVSLALFPIAVAIVALSYQSTKFSPVSTASTPMQTQPSDRPSDQWPSYANTERGDHYSSADQITPANVGKLKVAWSFRTGSPRSTFETTPIKVGDNLVFCTPSNEVISVDADTGHQAWRFDPKVDVTKVPNVVCRGVSYYAGAATATAFCDQRLMLATTDDRLIALDAATGKPCPDFGDKGSVDLEVGLGTPDGWHYVTSPPLVVGGLAVVGGMVLDNQGVDEASGVIRAYDVRTGELKWGWEGIGPNSRTLKPGETWTRGTPNMWSIASADPGMGLIYLPMGNPTPDYFGGLRSPEMDRYGSGIVALDIATGNVKWNFKTVHHDIWDMDIASQPIVTDIDTAQGRRAALVVPTKRGEIFLLDRATGKSLTPIVERAVPGQPVAGERLSPTQPYPVGTPSFSPPHLREADMWGATLLDQLLCRITFRERRYEGQFTPPSLQGSIGYPDVYGVFNWGGAAIDPVRQVMIVNPSYFPYLTKLIPRRVADASGVVQFGKPSPLSQSPADALHGWTYPQVGTPYAAQAGPFVSQLQLPCHQPPWGEIAALDLRQRKILWRRPLGTTRDSANGLALPLGVPNIGASVVTRSGIAFIGAAIDNYLRAFDVHTGRELWQARLPAGGQATPMTYTSRRSGRQYVVIAAGGNALMKTTPGDYVVAFALP